MENPVKKVKHKKVEITINGSGDPKQKTAIYEAIVQNVVVAIDRDLTEVEAKAKTVIDQKLKENG